MCIDKPFKTIDEQLKILENRNLLFLNKETARNSLKRYGYYEVINVYKDPFLKKKNDDIFKNETTFEHIYALYNLDKELSRDLLQGLEQFEQNFKQSLAYVISEKISADYSLYANKDNFNLGKVYRDKKKKIVASDRDNLLKKFHNIHNYQINPFKHYRDNHGNIPPWIMVKGLTFGQTIYWYRLSSKEIRLSVLSIMLGIDENIIRSTDSTMKYSQTFGDLLALYLNYRNLTAHGSRVYNYRSNKYRLRRTPLLYNNNGIKITTKEFNDNKYRSSLGVVLYSLSIFENQDPYLSTNSWVITHLQLYLKKYPNDIDYLWDSMELSADKLLNKEILLK